MILFNTITLTLNSCGKATRHLNSRKFFSQILIQNYLDGINLAQNVNDSVEQ